MPDAARMGNQEGAGVDNGAGADAGEDDHAGDGGVGCMQIEDWDDGAGVHTKMHSMLFMHVQYLHFVTMIMIRTRMIKADKEEEDVKNPIKLWFSTRD